MRNTEEGGVVVQVDNSSAFDLVRWEYTHMVLEELGLPEEFRTLMKILYKDIGFTLKVNGGVGDECKASNGVRQGCGVSPLIFILVQEGDSADEYREGYRVARRGTREERGR